MAGTIMKVRTTNGDVPVDFDGLANKPDTDTNERLTTLEAQMADLLYEPIQINSFSHNQGTAVYGQTITDVTLSWSTNKTPTALTLDGSALDLEYDNTELSGLTITKDAIPTWTLKATDERGTTATKSLSISFGNYVYTGVAGAPSSYNSAFVTGLDASSVLTSTRINKTCSFTAGSGKYIYVCIPTKIGNSAVSGPTFAVGGFTGGFTLVSTIDVTNAYGYTSSYYIYKSDNANLGSTTVSIANY